MYSTHIVVTMKGSETHGLLSACFLYSTHIIVSVMSGGETPGLLRTCFCTPHNYCFCDEGWRDSWALSICFCTPHILLIL